jgi:membrane associated rhomboid family serine protease
MKNSVATYAIIGITAILSVAGIYNRNLFEKNLFSVSAILQRKEIHRLLTSIFFHVNWAHLFFNMFSLYSFGTLVEESFGPKFMTAIYFCSGIGGGLLSLLIKRKFSEYSAVGASGAVCGIIFASIFLLPGGSIYIIPIPVPIPSWAYAILFIIISFYGIGKGASIIGHEAHLGGALVGILWALIYRPSLVMANYLLFFGLTVPLIALIIYFSLKKI